LNFEDDAGSCSITKTFNNQLALDAGCCIEDDCSKSLAGRITIAEASITANHADDSASSGALAAVRTELLGEMDQLRNAINRLEMRMNATEAPTGAPTEAPTKRSLMFISNTGSITNDGSQFSADGDTPGNGHQGMGMTYGPAVVGININDYCEFRGAYQGSIKGSENTPSTYNDCGDGNGCGDTGYGCKAWAHAPGTVFTGGYNWPKAIHQHYHTTNHVVYSRFTRVGSTLSQRYFLGGRNEWFTKTIDEITTPVDAYSFVSGTSIPSDSGVIITLGEASSCEQIDGGPAGCPFVIVTANF
jgi:hypothetical protein